MDCCVARWAVAHFGQKPAGSPLNCFTLCLLRHLAMRGVAPGERRGAGKKTMLGSYGRTICPVPGGHRVSVSWEGGSLATKADAEAADAYWQELCDSLGVPLNLGRWQQCRQSGAGEYTGFIFDTMRASISDPELEAD